MRILFKKGCHSIEEEDMTFLDSIALNLRLHRGFRVTVVGHLATEGVAQYDNSLPRKRTSAVLEVLKGFGIPISWVDCELWKGRAVEVDSVHLFVFKV